MFKKRLYRKRLSAFSPGTTANIQVHNESQYVIPCRENVFSIEGKPGWFYIWLKSVPSSRNIENQMLETEILQAFENSKKIYGSPRITQELHKKNIKVSRPRVARIMRKANLRSIVEKKFKVITDSNHKFPIPENKLDRDFKPGTLGAVWVSDITYIKTKQGWLYLTTVIDLGDRKVIGWALSTTMKAIDTVIPAFKMAQKNRPIIQELIFHSDRGVQYACNEFKSLLDKNNFIIRSMSRKAIVGITQWQRASLKHSKPNVIPA